MNASKTIVDIGVSEGNDSKFYLEKGFRVFGIEGDPIQCEKIENRFNNEIQRDLYTLIPAIASNAANTNEYFYVNSKNQGHSRVAKENHLEKNDEDIYTVSTIDWPALFKITGPIYYCKIDIEGEETNFLSSFDSENLPQYISAECHTVKPISKLHELGYTKFKLINQCLLHTFTAPEPALEGNYLPDHRFNHSSGYFGKELPGSQWFSYDEALELYETIVDLKKIGTIIGSGVWFDVHATL